MADLRSLHFRVQLITRGQHKSSVAAASYRSGKRLKADAPTRSALAAAAYRSGEILYDEHADKTFDYTRKEDIYHSEIIAPRNAPEWVNSRQTLWNTVETLEKRKDAQLARDVIAVFPRELNMDQCKTMLKEYVNDNFVSKGMVADLSIHEVDASDGGRNPHAHIMLTMREIGTDGFGKKNREWNDQKLVTHWRKSWEEYSNRHLEQAGHDVRVTLQSYENLGVDKMPGVHMGAEQWQLENRKGKKTQRGNKNREIKHENVINDSVNITLESEDRLNDQWETILETVNPESEKITPIQGLGIESLVLNDDKADHGSAGEKERQASFAPVEDATSSNRQQAIVGKFEQETKSAAEEQHYAAVNDYIESEQFDTATRETKRTVSMKRYASRFMEATRELAGKAYQQFANLMRETIRERDKDKGYER